MATASEVLAQLAVQESGERPSQRLFQSGVCTHYQGVYGRQGLASDG
jgi:hypothetical protein